MEPEKYEELPELSNAMLLHAKVKKGGRPVFRETRPTAPTPLRLAADLIERWKASWPGLGQTRMAERLRKVQ